MHLVVPDVYAVEGMLASNVYVLASGNRLALIDCGLPGSVKAIAAQLEQGGHALSTLHTIVVTHAHMDHIGGLADLVAGSGAQVLAHRAEAAYIDGTKSLPPASMPQRAVKLVGELVGRKPPSIHVSRELDDGEVIDVLGGLKVIHVPGHTPGSICLYQPERKLLFCGDLLRTDGDRLHYSPAFFSLDDAEARRSVRRLSGLPVEVLCPGHGAPILAGADKQISALLAEAGKEAE